MAGDRVRLKATTGRVGRMTQKGIVKEGSRRGYEREYGEARLSQLRGLQQAKCMGHGGRRNRVRGRKVMGGGMIMEGRQEKAASATASSWCE